jgi:hypothetical protein
MEHIKKVGGFNLRLVGSEIAASGTKKWKEGHIVPLVDDKCLSLVMGVTGYAHLKRIDTRDYLPALVLLVKNFLARKQGIGDLRAAIKIITAVFQVERPETQRPEKQPAEWAFKL